MGLGSAPGPGIGGIAQLAEHELCKLGVTGSSPVASTIRGAMSGALTVIARICTMYNFLSERACERVCGGLW
jgi:hypothetical protein